MAVCFELVGREELGPDGDFAELVRQVALEHPQVAGLRLGSSADAPIMERFGWYEPLTDLCRRARALGEASFPHLLLSELVRPQPLYLPVRFSTPVWLSLEQGDVAVGSAQSLLDELRVVERTVPLPPGALDAAHRYHDDLRAHDERGALENLFDEWFPSQGLPADWALFTLRYFGERAERSSLFLTIG